METPTKYRYIGIITESGLSPVLKGNLLEWAKKMRKKEVKEVIEYLKSGKSWEESIEIIENRLKLKKKIIV
tara:strand:- start:5510 stop:5722 length:213 start_codon:yes stop_codon:yes gene_type:complete